MKSVFKTDNHWRSLVAKRMCDLDYTESDFSTTDLGGGSPSFDLSSLGVDPLGNNPAPQTLDNGFAITTTPNPSLSSSPYSSLFDVGGAPMNTVSPNPTLYSSGSSGTVREISSISSAIGQWGYGISSMLGVGSPLPQPAYLGANYRPVSGVNNNGKLLLLGLVILAVILVVHEE